MFRALKLTRAKARIPPEPHDTSVQLPFLLRDLGQRLFRNVPIRVATGINQGMRWSIVSTGRGYGSGSFGRERLEALQAVVRRGDCLWDIGAHKGFVTLAASRMVGPEGCVVAVEPSARNLWFVERHVGWNGMENVVIVPVALSDRRGQAPFGGRGDSLAYTLGEGDERVPVRTIPDVIAERQLPHPAVLKIDAEGQEAAILDGAGPLLRADAAVLISVHGREMHAACTHLLSSRDFRLFESWEMARCSADPERPWTSDYDLLAVGPQRPVDEESIVDLPLFSRPG